MRVTQLTQRFPPAIGGVEQHVYHLAKGLSQAGVEVKVLTTDLMRSTPFARLESRDESAPFPIIRVRARKLFEAPLGLGIIAPSMVFETMDRGSEVLHAHGYGTFPTFAASLGQALDHSTLVITPHSDAGRRSWSKSLFDTVVPPLTLRRASRVIAVSHHEADHLTSLGVAPEAIRVIPNGVDLGEFAASDASRRSDESVTVLFVGRVDSEQKGLPILIEALGHVPRSKRVSIRIAGEDWGGMLTLRERARHLGVAERVTFLGKLDRSALLREYAAADFLVLPSLFEPFGIVLLEAMAAGLPVVASRVGGVPEVVEDGRTGWLVEAGNPRALADSMTRLADDEAMRRKMGRAGREKVLQYGWDAIVPQVVSVYREAIEDRGG